MKDEAKDRKREDTDRVEELICNGLGIEEVDIMKAIRLGKKDAETSGKNRLLKITVENITKKREILSNAKKLREVNAWKGIYINPDLTPKERETNKILREDLKRRKDNGEVDLVIRRGKIIKSFRKE